MSAGREDVDVRCLGDGRPFAIEVRFVFNSLPTVSVVMGKVKEFGRIECNHSLSLLQLVEMKSS